jgi:hypothetical protein
MRTAKQILDEQFLEMRWRCLSLAADLDRIHCAPGGDELLHSDPMLRKFHEAFSIMFNSPPNRATEIQMLFSDSSREIGK